MGRLLGSHASDDGFDRSDLNKCPDCGCFFAQNNCPLCGKECPEEMRAGNRKPPKIKRHRNGSNRVTFIDWYHSWWFIIVMMFFFPLVGIILLASSPHKRSSKIIFIVLAIIYGIISSFGIGNLINKFTDYFEKTVNTSLSKTEYMAKCEYIEPEEYYRLVGEYEGKYLSTSLKVEKKIIGGESPYGDDNETYYLCHGQDENGEAYSIIIRDCIIGKSINLIAGDIITVYGQGAGNVTIHDSAFNTHHAVCINVAYIK